MSECCKKLPFDKLTDCSYANGILSFWGYDSRQAMDIQRYSFELNKGDFIELQCEYGSPLTFGNIFPLNERYKHTYCARFGVMLELKDSHTLLVRPCSRWLHFKHELGLIGEYLKIHTKHELYGICVRAVYRLFFSRSKLKKPTMLLCDRRDRAGDNAEALFKYLNREHPGEYEYYFALEKKSQDWNRMQQYGKVININGIRYMRLYWAGALVVSSYADLAVWLPFRGRGYDTYKDIVLQRKTVFLGHGVKKDDFSMTYNAEKTPSSIFVTTTVPEYRSMIERKYGFVEGQVKMTGLPRYDYLKNEPRKIITYMPTWRVSLRGVSREEFEGSEFYRIQQKLLMEPEFANKAEKYGYEIHVMLHPMMENIKQWFADKFDHRIRVLPYNTSYSDIFSRSSLLVTDYSSVAFDFAYLRKTVLYYQEDSEAFFSGTHNYVPGYYDYERDGFGEVLLSKEAFLDTIESYLETECKPKEKYLNRINATFSFNDRKNCARVFEEIKKI